MKIELDVPESLKLDSEETRQFLAAKLYEAGKLTLGQAAELAHMGKVAFAEILNNYDVALINYRVSELTADAARI